MVLRVSVTPVAVRIPDECGGNVSLNWSRIQGDLIDVDLCQGKIGWSDIQVLIAVEQCDFL